MVVVAVALSCGCVRVVVVARATNNSRAEEYRLGDFSSQWPPKLLISVLFEFELETKNPFLGFVRER